MDSQKILLVFGAGPNIGLSLAERFKAAGYKVVLVSRSIRDTEERTPYGDLTLQADLKDYSSVPTIFATVKAKLGGSPTVVVYNAAGLTMPKDLANIFTVPVESLEDDLAVMNTSAYVAAGQAVEGFTASQNDTPKAFIYTGNILAAVALPVPRLTTLGSGKSAASYWIGAASLLFKDRGFKLVKPDTIRAALQCCRC
jgi:NAD(P)-dependent dehydrogenase (short-subunit alcohol dehydrogenase family)